MKTKAQTTMVRKAFDRVLGTREGWCAGATGNYRELWQVAYRDWRKYAHIACDANDDLVAFRGFGILKTAYATDYITHVGRLRVNDSRQWNYRAVADRLGLTPKDWNPSRRFALTIG